MIAELLLDPLLVETEDVSTGKDCEIAVGIGAAVEAFSNRPSRKGPPIGQYGFVCRALGRSR